MNRHRFIAAIALPLALAFVGISPPARAVIVERVVAVVGERPILLSELRTRARPNLLRLLATPRDPSFHAAAETEIYKEFLNRMIDERLEESAADKARITVSLEEVDHGIANVAANAKVSIPELIVEVRRQGLTEQDFRDEIRRQILEGKLIELRVRPRVRATEQDARATYQRWVKEFSEQHPTDLRVLALRVAGDEKARLALADQIVARARAGEDFCALVTEFSDDVETRGTCGSRGPQPFAALVPQVQDAVRSMKSGQVSDPLYVRGATEAIAIVQLLNEPHIPPYEEVKGEMMQRAVMDGIDRQRKLWIGELRRGVYIDVRL